MRCGIRRVSWEPDARRCIEVWLRRSKPMRVEEKVSVEIDAPPEAVWAAVARPEVWP
jgi:hypothetical protein